MNAAGLVAAPVWRHRAAAVYLLAAIAGALASGVILLLASGMLRPITATSGFVRSALFASVLVYLAAGSLAPEWFGRPQNRRQVPDAVIPAGPWRGAAQFGFEMGTGVRTYVTTSAPYALAAFMAFGRLMPLTLLAAAASFGVGRGATNFVYLWSGDSTRSKVRLVTLVSNSTAIALLAGAWILLEI